MKVGLGMMAIAMVLSTRASVTEAQTGASDRAVASHRAAYAAIVKDFPRMRRAEADMDSLGIERMSTEGGTLEAWCTGNALRLVVARYNGEYGRGIERFYFKDGRLFFVLDRHEFSDRLYGPTVRREEERLYLDGPTLVRWLGTNGRPQSVTSAAAVARTREAVSLGALFGTAMANCQPHPQPAR